MAKRLKNLSDKFFFPSDKIYRNYFDCIEWDENTFLSPTSSRGRFPYAFYRNIIPRWLPLAEGVLWAFLLLLLVFGISISSLGQTSVG